MTVMGLDVGVAVCLPTTNCRSLALSSKVGSVVFAGLILKFALQGYIKRVNFIAVSQESELGLLLGRKCRRKNRLDT